MLQQLLVGELDVHSAFLENGNHEILARNVSGVPGFRGEGQDVFQIYTRGHVAVEIVEHLFNIRNLAGSGIHIKFVAP